MRRDDAKDVVIVNIQNFPAGMVLLFENMQCGTFCKKDGAFLPSCYATNANATASLHDMLVYAPLNAMCDSAWHPWSAGSAGSETIFHTYLGRGFDTYFVGPFGLDSYLDPHTQLLKQEPIESIARMYGITHFLGSKDDAFDCERDSDYDARCLAKIGAVLDEPRSDKPKFIWVNLVGCEEIPRVCIGLTGCKQWTRCVTLLSQTGTTDRPIALPVSCDDDPRNDGTLSASIEGCRRAAALEDSAKDQTARTPHDRDIAIRTLHDMAYAKLSELDAAICKVFARECVGVRCVLSTHSIGLREHGCCEHMPWQSCSRSFICLSPCEAHHTCLPHSILYLHTLLALRPTRKKHCDDCVLTLGASPSWLTAAGGDVHAKLYFLRATAHIRNREYAVHVWHSAREPFTCNVWSARGFGDLREKLHVLVFDLSSDPNESKNIAHEEWCATELAALLFAQMKAAAQTYEFRSSPLVTPHDVAIHVIRATPCVMWTPKPPVRDAAAQTAVPTLIQALQAELLLERFASFRHSLDNHHSGATFLVPLKNGPCLVLSRAYRDVELGAFADARVAVYDIGGASIGIGRNDDGHVIIADHKLLRNTSRWFCHFGGTSCIIQTSIVTPDALEPSAAGHGVASPVPSDASSGSFTSQVLVATSTTRTRRSRHGLSVRRTQSFTKTPRAMNAKSYEYQAFQRRA